MIMFNSDLTKTMTISCLLSQFCYCWVILFQNPHTGIFIVIERVVMVACFRVSFGIVNKEPLKRTHFFSASSECFPHQRYHLIVVALCLSGRNFRVLTNNLSSSSSNAFPESTQLPVSNSIKNCRPCSSGIQPWSKRLLLQHCTFRPWQTENQCVSFSAFHLP